MRQSLTQHLLKSQALEMPSYGHVYGVLLIGRRIIKLLMKRFGENVHKVT